MAVSRRVYLIREQLDVDLQLLALEWDTSAADLMYLCEDLFAAPTAFRNLIADIEDGDGVEVTSMSDDTVLYEYLGEKVAVYSTLEGKFLLFDISSRKKIEDKLRSYIIEDAKRFLI